MLDPSGVGNLGGEKVRENGDCYWFRSAWRSSEVSLDTFGSLLQPPMLGGCGALQVVLFVVCGTGRKVLHH